MKAIKIYVASSWRNNSLYPLVVQDLRQRGHEVYDFKAHAFAWRDLHIGADWQNWTLEQQAEALAHSTSQVAFKRDMTALKEADACVCVLPCGRSAHLELGYAVGAGKRTTVLQLTPCEAELMYLMCTEIIRDYNIFLRAYD